jgi:hypothetical protein
MIPGQPVPTELDAAAERVAQRHATKARDVAPRRRATAAAGAEALPTTDEETVGVVFIHGIGSQRAGETLLAWSAPIIRILSAWRRDQRLTSDPVIRSSVDLTGRTTPFIELEIAADPSHPAATPPGRWVLTEAWWGSDVEPPGISTMLRWLIWRGEARQIGDGILTGINAADDARRPASGGFEETRRMLRDVLERFLILGLFIVLALVAVPIYTLVKLLTALPLPTIAQTISTAQLDWFLADWFGDVRVLLSDRAQAANIRSRVRLAIEALREYGCGRIVLVGHSGGTIVGYMTLADLPADLAVDAFITHGQALRLAWRLGHFGGPLAEFTPVEGDEDELLRRGDRLVRPLPGELRWDDFWATHDPAPAGPLDDPATSVSLPTESHPVTNRNSIVNDHGGYWDNEEGFVIPVMRLLDTAGRRPVTASRFFPGYSDDDPRIVARQERVTLLSRFWLLWLTLAIGTAVVGMLAGGRGLSSFGTFVLGLPGSLREPSQPGVGLWAWLVGAVAIGVLTYAVQRIAIARWDEWDDESRARARHTAFVPAPPGSLIGQWALLLVAQFVVVILAVGGTPRPLLLAVYLGLLLAGWFPREWRARLVPPDPRPPD